MELLTAKVPSNRPPSRAAARVQLRSSSHNQSSHLSSTYNFNSINFCKFDAYIKVPNVDLFDLCQSRTSYAESRGISIERLFKIGGTFVQGSAENLGPSHQIQAT